MKTSLLLAGVSAILFAATASHAADPESEQYAQRANAKADALLHAAGVDTRNQTVSVRAKVRYDGSLSDIAVVRSSGSPDVDHAVSEVLRRIVHSDPPLGLANGAVTLNVGRATFSEAGAR